MLKRVESATEPEKYGIANSVWIYCGGEHPADSENLGAVTYYPEPYIRNYYFPFKSQKLYASPFIFVHFERPVRKSKSKSLIIPLSLVLSPSLSLVETVINIRCIGLANNIHPYDRASGGGYVGFHIFVDDDQDIEHRERSGFFTTEEGTTEEGNNNDG